MAPATFSTAEPASASPPASSSPPFNDWLGAARPLNPTASDPELAQFYLQRYGRPDPATLPSWQDFAPQARSANPDMPDSALKDYWTGVYGRLGAPEHGPGFVAGVAKGLRQGAASLGESVAGAAEFLSPHGHPFQAIAKGAGDAMRAEAEKYASPQALAQQPWYQRLTNPHAMGQLLGEMAVETAPSLAAFGAGATVGSVGGLPGALATGTLAMAGTIFLQTAGQTFREAQARYLQQGVPTAQAQQQAFRDAGFAGLVSGAVNALGIPASLVAPFRRTLSNLVLQYGLNVGVDTADQITQNVIAQHTFAPERPLSEGVPEAVVGSALLSTPEMLLAAKGARRLQAPPSAAMPAPTTRPLAGIMRQPTVEGAIAQAEQAITGPPVTPSALDAAIAGHRYLEETSSSARPRVAPELDAAIQDQLERFGSREATRTLGAQTPLIEGSPTRGAQEGIEVVTPPRPKRDYLAPTEEEAARTRLQAERENLLAQRRTPAPEPRDLTPSEVELAQVWRTYREATTPEARAAILARAEPAVRSYLREQATLHATPETTMPTTAQIVARRTAGLPASEAPVTPQTVAPPDLQFNGVQHSAGDQPPLELWTLHSPYPGLTEGSTYSRETLERHGVAVPAAPTEPATPHERTSMPEMYGGGEGEVETELPRSPGQPTPAEADKTGPVQTEIPIPPETVGTRPLIGREATPAGAPRIAEGSTPYESAPIFSSQALRVIEQKMPARASREQVRGILSPANGVKPDELKWTGLDDYLKTKDDFSKPEIMEYLRTHQVQLREVQYHAPSASMADNLRALDAAYIESRQRFEQARDESQKGTFRPEAIVAFHRAQAEMQAADLARREAYEQSNSSRPRFENVVLPGGTSYRELLLTLPTHAPVYSSPHWTEPNVLAHVRMDDRTTPDGKRMLFLEEIQSDWHQEGRRTGGVPAAPFAKTWPELVLKRMLRYAAEHGYDELGWTTGAQQAARYDLSKQVDKIVWHEHDGLYDLSATKNSQRMPIKDDVPTDKLEQYVGKDAARKIIEAEQARKQGQSTRTFIEGNDLKVGGDGMQRFYDQILPAFLNRYGKKWGARVQTVDLRGVDQDATPVFNPDTGKDAWPTITVHAIPITEAMRRSVLTSGQALFQNSRPYGRSSADTRQLTLDALGDLDRVVGQVSHERRDLGRATQGASGSSRARFLGLGYRRELIQTGRLDLRGQILRTPEDLAVLGQIVRDPRFETFRIVYLRGTELVGHEAISSRLPGQSLAFVRRRGAPLNLSRAFYDMRDRMRRLRADGYYLLHNHPSGNPTPSLPDRYVTQLYARHVPGFRGHVIVDSGTWGEITAAGDVAVYPLRTAGAVDPLLEAGIPHRLLGATVARAADVATIGKDLQSPARYVAILYVGGNGRVRALQEMPVGLFVRPREATDYLRGRSVETGASRAFAYVAEPSQEVSAAANALIRNGSLIDFVHGAGASRLTSVAPHPTMAFGRMVESVPGYRVSEPGEHATGSLDSSVPPLTTLDAAIRTWLDQFVDVRRMVEGLKAAGQQVSDELNPVYREELYLGRVAHETRQFLSDELLGLTQAMRLSKVTQAQLDRYLYARHAQEANAYLREINPDRDDRDALSGMTDEEADRILKEAPASMERLGRRVDAIVARTRDLMVSYGLESQATIDAWRARYQYYVPLQRAGFEDEGTRGTGSGRDIRGSTVKARLGSNREATNILANIALQRERVIVRGEKMRPVVALAGLMMQYPDHAIATLAKPAPITYTDPETGLQKTVPGDVGDYRVPTIRTLNRRSGQVEVRPDPAYQGRDNVVNFRVDGIDYAIVFNEDNARAVQMARALKGLDIASLNGLLQVVAPVTRFFAAINTQYSPFFGIRNLLRDAGFASLSLSSTPLAGQQRTVARYAIESLRGIYAEARSVRQGEHAEGVAAQWWRRFEAAGGPTGYRDLFQGSTDRARAIEAMLNPDWWATTTGGKVVTAGGLLAGPAKVVVDRVGRPLFQWLSDYNLMMENAIRVGVFRAGVEHGLSHIQAASLAKNITVNFNRKGTVTAQVGALYAFFNASTQGSARVVETLLQAGKRGQLSRAGTAIAAGGILLGVMQAAMLQLAGFGADEPPEWQRETNFIVPLPGPDRRYLSVPYPLGFNILPNIGRLATEAAIYGDTLRKAYTFLGVAMDAFSPFGSAPTLSQVLSPTVTDPLIALEENKDWRGRPIAREDYDTLRPTPGHTRAKPGASAWGLAMSRAINWATGGNEYRRGLLSPTPDQIDYLIAQFTGGVGREMGRAARVVTAVSRGEESPLSSVPLVGQYVGSSTGSQAVRDRFYRHVRDLNQLEAELKGRRQHGEPTAPFLQEHPEARLAAYARLSEQTVSLLQQRKRAAIERGARDDVQRLDGLITTHMQRLNDRLQQMAQRR